MKEKNGYKIINEKEGRLMGQEWRNLKEVPAGTEGMVFLVDCEGNREPIVDREKKPLKIIIITQGKTIKISSTGGEKITPLNSYQVLSGTRSIIFVSAQN